MRVALVLGGAACVWSDVDAAQALGEFAGAVGCNHIGIDWPGRLDAWVTLHLEYQGQWARARRARGLPDHHAIIGNEAARSSTKPQGCIDRFTENGFPGQVHGGSSGLFALKVALVDLGFDRAVLCGVPMEPGAAHIRDAGPWVHADHYRKAWIEALPQIRDRARSMGGWTQQLLGAPDAGWIGGST
jgi:hypothetical protein